MKINNLAKIRNQFARNNSGTPMTSEMMKQYAVAKGLSIVEPEKGGWKITMSDGTVEHVVRRQERPFKVFYDEVLRVEGESR